MLVISSFASLLHGWIGSVKNPKGLIYLLGICFLLTAPSGFFSAFFASYVKLHGWTSEDVSYILSLSHIGSMALMLFSPFFFGKIAPRTLIMVTSALEALALGLCYYASPLLESYHIPVLFFLYSAANSLLWIVPFILLNQWADEQKRGSLLSFGMLFCSFGGTCGAQFLFFIDFSSPNAFLAASFFFAVIVLIAFFGKSLNNEICPVSKEPVPLTKMLSWMRSYTPLLSLPLSLILLYKLYYRDISSFVPIWDLDQGISHTIISWSISGFSIGNMVLPVIFGFILDRFGRPSLIVVGVLSLLIITTGEMWGVDKDGSLPHMITYFVMGGILATLSLLQYKIIGDHFTSADIPAASSVTSFYGTAAGLIIPVALGWWLQNMPAYLFIAPLMACSVVTLAFFIRHVRPSQLPQSSQNSPL